MRVAGGTRVMRARLSIHAVQLMTLTLKFYHDNKTDNSLKGHCHSARILTVFSINLTDSFFVALVKGKGVDEMISADRLLISLSAVSILKVPTNAADIAV